MWGVLGKGNLLCLLYTLFQQTRKNKLDYFPRGNRVLYLSRASHLTLRDSLTRLPAPLSSIFSLKGKGSNDIAKIFAHDLHEIENNIRGYFSIWVKGKDGLDL